MRIYVKKIQNHFFFARLVPTCLNCSYTRKIWKNKHANIDKINLLMKNTDWGNVICDAENIDSAILNFSSILLTLIHECIPEISQFSIRC